MLLHAASPRIPALFFSILGTISVVFGCSSHFAENSSHNTTETLEIGTDGTANAETIGYTINHFALISNNLTATWEFYGTLLGMRHNFTYSASEN
ncbi:hypothetical protein DL98DRAFT_662678 [Cadophora sp. DSE1049]|nr:hypothetical protein DL98DRAFT_662678 [Cadophora sp. DSE1049]